MLNTLRESAHGIFAKILLGLLVLSFAIWGIGDIFRNGGGASSVASVGRDTISQQEYQVALRHKRDELRQMLGNAYKPEMLRKFGLDRQVLFSLINSVLMEKESAALGIVISDEALAEAIRTNPSFQDKDGQFSRDVYMATLRSNNMTEAHYVEELRKELAGTLLSSTIEAAVSVPDELAQALYKARGEQRTADMLEISSNAVSVPDPTDKDLQVFYEKHEKAFLAPEVRTLSYIEIKPLDIQAKVNVSEDEIKRTYEEHLQDYHRAERRVIEQMLFAKESDAKAAADKLTAGAAFADVAKSASVLNKDKLTIGTLTRQDAPKEAAETVFTLKEGQNTPPVETSFGWHIFHVSKIEPESTAPLAEVRPDIIKDIAGREAQDTIYKLVNNVEDMLAGGSTLENAAEKIGQKVQKTGPVTREGTSPEGKKIALPADPGFLNSAFSTAEKEHSAAIQGSDGSYYLARVDSVVPAHARPLAEVKPEVATAWKAEKKAALLDTLAHAIATDLRAGKKPGDVLSAHKVAITAVSSGKLKRSSDKVPEGPLAGKVLPHALLLELFGLKQQATTQAYPATDGSYLIATLTQITLASEGDAKALGAIRDELKEQMGSEMVHEYLLYLTHKYRVSINESLLGVKDEEGGE